MFVQWYNVIDAFADVADDCVYFCVDVVVVVLKQSRRDESWVSAHRKAAAELRRDLICRMEGLPEKCVNMCWVYSSLRSKG